jgi:hypothetical protein
MRNSVLKKLIVFTLVVITVFSNIPFYTVSGLINSAEEVSGIVDKIWLLQREHNYDVVDNFSSARNIASKLKVVEAMAAITYQSNSAVAYSATSGTSVSVAYPTSIVANDMLVMIIGMKSSVANSGTVTTPSGWTPITSLIGAGGYGTTIGADVGNTNIYGYYKVAVGGETGSLTVTVGTNSVTWGQMYRMTGGAGSTWSVAGATGSDTASGNVSIAYGSNPGVTTGDYIIGGMVIPTDVTTPSQFSAEALSQSGITFGTITEVGEPDSANGNDIGGVTYRTSVNSGTATANPTFTATAGGTTTNVRGPGIFIRVREIPKTTTISNFVSAEPTNGEFGPSDNIQVDSFGLVTNSGTDTMTAATIGLSSGMYQYIQTVAITNDAGTTTYCSATPASDSVSLSGCTVPITTTNTQFKINLTADPHASMPVPPGGSYAVTARITAFTATGTTSGTDSGSATVTIDNTSPGNATSVSGLEGNGANTLNWTTVLSDFNTVSGSVVYRWTGSSAGSEVPAEGSTQVTGSTNGTATVACVVSSNASTALSKIDGTGGSAECTTAALTNGQDYTYKVFQKDSHDNYNTGLLIGTFTPVEPIVLSSYTNSTETALNYTASCTNCGARIGSGSGFRHSITITGSGFGTVAAGSRSTSAYNIKIGTHQIADANVTSWTPTSITFLTDSSVTGDTDADWGTVFGGANALTVTVNSVASSGLNFYLFPQVTSITVPTAVANAAREYNAADTDGVVTLNGTRFGTSASGGWVRFFGCDATTCSSPSGSATTNSWSNTAIVVQVPAVIADNIYTGSVAMQQGAGSSNKSHTYTTTGFRILPRITSLSPTSGAVGAAVTINGNHLCQNGGTCPTVFDTNNKVTFTSSSIATVFTSWSSTAIVTAVPTSAVDGVINLTSNTYLSNNSATFGVLSPVPSDPTALSQFNNSALSPALSVGGTSSSTSIYLGVNMQADFSGGTLYPQIEYQPVGTAFTCTGTGACATATEGTGKAAPGPIDCSASANGCAITITPTDGVYHWQARVRHLSGGTNYYSNWVSYGGNSESGTDFKIDKTGPIITFAGADNCAGAVSSLSTNGATISWTVNESATGQLEYSKNSNLSSAVTSSQSSAFNHSFSLNNLDSNTTYYFRVKSTDSAGVTNTRPSASPYCSFTTGGVTQPAKTTKFYISGVDGTLAGGTATSSNFSVYVPENSVSVISSFVELTGFSSGWGTNNIGVSVNGQATSTYSFNSGSNSFKILYPVNSSNLNFDPVANTFNISTSLGASIVSSELILTYSFAP